MPHVVHILTVPESLSFLRGQAAFMRDRGYRLTAVTSPGDALSAFGRSEGIDVYPVEMSRRVSPAADVESLARLVALLVRLKPNLVHAHTPKGGLLGMIAATLARVPARIYHMRGLPLMTAHGRQRKLLTATERTSCALASRVLAVSASLREVALENRLCVAGKVAVLAGGSGNGVDTDRFDRSRIAPDVGQKLRATLGIPAEAAVVGFVGRLVRDKGVVELGDAFRALKKSHPGAHLIVGGPFEERDAVPVETRRFLEEDSHVHVMGFVADTAPIYAAIDVLALPTYREGFPNVPLEAAAMRVPVVATRVEGCVDAVVDGVTGILIPPRDASALVQALETYLNSPSLRRAHGDAGRARVEKSFRRERIWEALASVYDELVSA